MLGISALAQLALAEFPSSGGLLVGGKTYTDAYYEKWNREFKESFDRKQWMDRQREHSLKVSLHEAASKLGKMGQEARQKSMTPKQLSAIAKNAAIARWKK